MTNKQNNPIKTKHAEFAIPFGMILAYLFKPSGFRVKVGKPVKRFSHFYMKEEFKACFVSVTYKASFELLFHASTVTAGSWKFPGMTGFKYRQSS
ncbi:MAG: hypothetical protein GY749_38620 [Desulfobacteraceae bacterium]|nr:hypothetical protein [Desulfobacteraceae bacterium]